MENIPCFFKFLHRKVYAANLCNALKSETRYVIIKSRQHHINVVREALKRSPIVAILGPQQIGKITLAREIAALQELEEQERLYVHPYSKRIKRNDRPDADVPAQEDKGV